MDGFGTRMLGFEPPLRPGLRELIREAVLYFDSLSKEEKEERRDAEQRRRIEEIEAYEQTDEFKIKDLQRRVDSLESGYAILASRMLRVLSVLRKIAPGELEKFDA